MNVSREKCVEGKWCPNKAGRKTPEKSVVEVNAAQEKQAEKNLSKAGSRERDGTRWSKSESRH